MMGVGQKRVLPMQKSTKNALFAIQKRRWIEIGLMLFFWSAVALLTLGRDVLDPHRSAYGGLRDGEALHSILEFGVWALVTPPIFWLANRILPERVGWVRTIPIAIIMGVVIACLVDLMDHILWNTLVDSPFKRSLSLGPIISNFHFINEFFIYFAVLVAGMARAYFLRYQKQQAESVQLRMDASQLETHLAEARLRALRMQINPHFLFNTLHVISDHFEENPRAARTMIARLSEILRYTFEGTDTREVTLEEELRFLDNYLDIQRFRFEDRLQVDVHVAPDAMQALVPTLILQPLVENAIKHGISQLEAGGKITIEAARKADTLQVTVADNGPGSASGDGSPAQSTGIGLKNTIERLETLYGTGHTFFVESPVEGGYVAGMVIPYHTSSDHFLSAVDE